MTDVAKEIDTTNRWLIGKQGEQFIIALPPRVLTEEQALVFAAYLVAMVGDENRWRTVYDAVEAT